MRKLVPALGSDAAVSVWCVVSYYDWTMALRTFANRWEADAYAMELFGDNYSTKEIADDGLEAVLSGAFEFDVAAALLDQHAPRVTDGWLVMVTERRYRIGPEIME